MGNKESKEVQESFEVKTMRDLVENHDPAAMQEYIQNNLNQWKTENVKLAVTGKTNTGKSYFINTMNGAKCGDPNFAPQGSGNTTRVPKFYPYSKNRNIEFYDLPGIGTELIPKKNYVEKMELHRYDFIFIFFDSVIHQLDLWLIEQLTEMKKPFCIVRSKIDLDFDRAEDDGRDPGNVIQAAREKALESFERNEILKKHQKLFIISSKRPDLGELENLVSYLETNVSFGKAEAIMFALPVLTEQIIEKKFNQLKKRIILVTAGCTTIALQPLPFLDVGINIAIIISEVRHYINVFGLSRERIEQLEGFDISQLKANYFENPTANLKQLVLNGIKKASVGVSILLAESVFNLLVPIIGSVVSASTTAYIVYNYLKGVLDDMRDDATVVYRHIHHQGTR